MASITLNWSAPVSGDPPVTYNILRSTTSGGESLTPIAEVAAPATTYVDSAVTAGTTYYYEITATNPSGTSSPSNEAHAQAGLAPGTPVSLTAVSS